MKRMQRMLVALDSRERSNLAELTRVSGRVAKGRGALESLDTLIKIIRARASGGMAQAFRGGPLSVEEILEVEHRARSLRDELAKLATIREQAARELDELVQDRQLAADRWQRSSTRLRHVQSLDRRRVVRASARLMDVEEMEHADRRLSVRSPT